MYVMNDAHFEDQAIKIKKLYYKYKARRIVIDANGVGAGLVDFMVKPQIDLDTNEVIPDFGVYGGTQDDAYDEYKKYRTNATELDAMYLMKANAPINTECHTIIQSTLSSGKIKFLIDERTAKQKLLQTKVGQNMTIEARKDYLLPFSLTSSLREEIMNLREENEGLNIILKQSNRNIKKDKFSALKIKKGV